MKRYAPLCDRPDFDDDVMKAQACERVGLDELDADRLAAARMHLWHSARISRHANEGWEFDRKFALIAKTNEAR
ncbi:hypothetical protein IAG41_02130 [Sphingomonas sp. JC676]|uniref:hypothetical protein n=1 Tax=Sphingomonas sp. JC676 TaxID=2768065 RepID=UPI0016580C6A|nr:hypothetical protein [Sphingomonas sp. JC676]MBC9031178.1 hypothetical protein [Sphingomonas sp. JC676]